LTFPDVFNQRKRLPLHPQNLAVKVAKCAAKLSAALICWRMSFFLTQKPFKSNSYILFNFLE